MMPSQRVCDAESQARNTLSNGPLRAQSNGDSPEYSATWGIRQLPGICWYPVERTGHTVNQGGTADSVEQKSHLFVLDRDGISVEGVFI